MEREELVKKLQKIKDIKFWKEYKNWNRNHVKCYFCGDIYVFYNSEHSSICPSCADVFYCTLHDKFDSCDLVKECCYYDITYSGISDRSTIQARCYEKCKKKFVLNMDEKIDDFLKIKKYKYCDNHGAQCSYNFFKDIKCRKRIVLLHMKDLRDNIRLPLELIYIINDYYKSGIRCDIH